MNYQSNFRIIINTIPLLAKLTGVGRYVLEICNYLINKQSFDITFYYGYPSKRLVNVTDYETSKNDLVDRLLKIEFLKKIIRLILYKLSTKLIKKKFHLYWEPNHLLIDSINADFRLTTIHDLSVIKYPEFHPKDRVSFFKRKIDFTLKNSSHFITVSKTIKDEMIKELNVPENKITYIYNGYRSDIFKVYDTATLKEFKIKNSLPDRFILFAGTIEPRKNLKNLLIAYMQLPRNLLLNYKLILVGHSGWENQEIFEIINTNRNNIIYLGYKDNLSLAMLYNLCEVLVYPSIYEGFGLPPLEAMACGKPVITSNTSSMAELYHDCACLVNPHDPYSIKEGLIKVLEDEAFKNLLKEKGLQKVKEFSWEKSASEHAMLFKKILSSL